MQRLASRGVRSFSSKPGAGAASGNTLKGRRRFYEKAEIKRFEDQFVVELDGKVINTPFRNKLVLPTEPLALAIAYEWDAQEKTIEPVAMPLMTLACSAIDGTSQYRDHIVGELMRFLDTDTVLFRANPEEYGLDLVKLQRRHLSPLSKWMNSKYGQVFTSEDLSIASHPCQTVENVRGELERMSHWHLTATESLVAGCKSMIIPLALFHGEIDAQAAVMASRVEEEHQVDSWGLVEGGHDVDRVNLTAQVAAASFFIHVT